MGHVEWIPIAEMPEEFKDGREVLLWRGFSAVEKWTSFARRYQDDAWGWSGGQEADDCAPATHFAEINPPA